MQPLSDREREVVKAFLDQHATSNSPLPFPVKTLSKLLLVSFGWPTAQGKIRAIAIIEELKRAGAVRCAYAKNGTLRGIMVAERTGDAAITSKPDSAVVHDPVRPVVSLASPPKAPSRKKGTVRRARIAHETGDRNETRFYRLISEFLGFLRSRFPENIIEAQVSKSGKHNPRHGKTDVRDHHGDDVKISLRVQWGKTAAVDGELIYDAKSSRLRADIFNRTIRLYPEQKRALLKKAIVVGEDVPDAAIVGEVLKDMAAVDLVPASAAEMMSTSFLR